jgi:hypothetical protein
MADNQSEDKQFSMGMIVIGAAVVGGGAAAYTLHWKYGTPLRNPYWPHIALVGLVLLFVSTFTFRSRFNKWIVFRSIVLFTMGIIYPLCMILFLLKNVFSGYIPIGFQEIIIWIVCGLLIQQTNLSLNSHGFLQTRMARIPLKYNPGYPLDNKILQSGSALKNVIYRPTWKSLSKTTILNLALALSLIAAGLWPHFDLVALGLGGCFLIELLIIRFRFKVVISEDKIFSTTFFRTYSVIRSEITGAWWLDGLIVLQSPEDRVWINSNRYPPECRETVLSLLIGPDPSKNSSSDTGV